jgi:hypothetical protein
VNGENLQWFIFQSYAGGAYFRPTSQVMYLTDSIMWGTQAFGYRLTNLAFHILSSCLVYLLARQLTHNQKVAIVAMLLFAVLPVHAEAVSWIAARCDVICGFFYLASVLFFVLYRAREDQRLYVFSLVMYVLALASKEVAITLPLGILLYELTHSFSPGKMGGSLKRQLPFWIILGSFLGLRLLVFGRIGFEGMELEPGDWWYWFDGTLLNMFDPLVLDVDQGTRWLLLSVAALVLLFYRSRREVVFGLLWIPATYGATINSGPSDRSFYVASLGLTLVIASILMRSLDRWIGVPRSLGFAVVMVLIISYGSALVTRNQLHYRAGEVAQAIPQQVRTFYPSLPRDARLVFVGVPDQLPSGVLVYMTGLQPSMQLTYKDASLKVFKLDEFPDHVDEPERTFFFLVDHRRVYDRTDAMRALLSK